MDRKHVFGTWSYQSEVSPTEVAHTDGVQFTDAEGNEFIDFSGQLMCSNLGHSAEKVEKAVAEQISKVEYVSPSFTTELRAKLGKKLAEITPGNLTKTFFSTSGTEAVEAAIKIASFYTGNEKILSRYRSYHGARYGSISVTGDPRRLAAEPTALDSTIQAPAALLNRWSSSLFD